MTTLLLALCLAQDNPLQPLTEIQKKMNEAGALLMKGEDPANAFKPWTFLKEEGDFEKLRADLKTAGATSLEGLGFELELYFMDGNTPVYRVSSYVVFVDGVPGLVEMSGGAAEGASGKCRPVSDFSAALAPFGKAAENLAKSLRKGEAPATDPEKLRKLVPEKMPADLKERMAKEAAKIAKELGDKEYTIYVAIDDLLFLARNESNLPVGGVKGEFEFGKEPGSLAISLNRYKGFK